MKKRTNTLRVLGALLLFSIPTATIAQTTIPIPGGNAGQAGATGWQHTGVTLRSADPFISGGDYVLDGRTTPLVVDGYDFLGRTVTILGNVTVKRSRIRNNVALDCAAPAIAIEAGAGPVLIEDTEITTTNPNVVGGGARQDRTICVHKDNNLPVTLNRVWSHDTMRGIDITSQNNVTIQDSYLGPNVSPPIGQPPGSCLNSGERQHASAIRAAGGTHDILLSNTVLHIGSCSWASGLIATYPEHGANYDWEIAGGRWIIEGQNGGAYGIAAGYTPGVEQQNHDFNIHDLQISTQYYSDGCPSGCDQNWQQLAGTNYFHNVRIYHPGFPDDGALYPGSTGGSSDTTPPTNPGSLATSGVTSSQVNLSWTASTDASGIACYEVYRCTGASCTPSSGGTLISPANHTATTFSDTGVAANTTYRYQVRAKDRANPANFSGFTAIVTAATPVGTSAPEANVTGNGVSIADGDTSPGAADRTDFGIVNVASGFTTYTYTIQNQGTAAMTVGSVTVSGSDFTVTAQPATSISAGGSSAFSVKFDPSAAGLRGATVSFTNNDANENPYNLSIQGIGSTGPEVIVDNNDAGVVKTGEWLAGSSSGYYGVDYLHDGNTAKGSKSVRFTPNLPSAGVYEAFAWWVANSNRATNVPIDIVNAGTTGQVQVNQRVSGSAWVSLGQYNFNSGTGGSVLIKNAATDGYVVADAVRFVAIPSIPSPKTNTDVGAPTPTGSASYWGGVYTINAGGANFGGASEQFHYVSQSLTSSGTTLIARVTGLTNLSDAKAGIMFRGGTGASDPFMMISVAPSGTLKLGWRSSTGTSTISSGTSSGGAPSATTPKWLKIVKSNAIFTCFYANGTAVPTTWTAVGGAINVNLPSTYRAGIFVNSKNAAALATGTFDNVTP